MSWMNNKFKVEFIHSIKCSRESVRLGTELITYSQQVIKIFMKSAHDKYNSDNYYHICVL